MVPLQIDITDVNQTNYEDITLDAYDWNGDMIQGNVSIGVPYTGQAVVLAFMGNETFSPETWGGLSTLKETQPDGAGDYFLMVPPSAARAGQGVIVALGVGTEGYDSTESFTVWSSQLVSTPASNLDFSWNASGYKVEGFVKDGASNDPVFYSQVLLYKVGSPDQFAGYATTDGEGRYAIHYVPAGTYKLAAISRHYPAETVWTASFTITSSDVLRPDILMGGSAFDELAVDLGSLGLYRYDGTAMTRLTTWKAQAVLGVGNVLYADFGGTSTGGRGLYKYDAGVWSRINVNDAQGLTAVGSDLYADMGSLGVYKYNGTSFSRVITWNAEALLGVGNVLYADFGGTATGGRGLYKYDGAWARINVNDAEVMCPVNLE
jgi:hypothetical protein